MFVADEASNLCHSPLLVVRMVLACLSSMSISFTVAFCPFSARKLVIYILEIILNDKHSGNCLGCINCCELFQIREESEE